MIIIITTRDGGKNHATHELDFYATFDMWPPHFHSVTVTVTLSQNVTVIKVTVTAVTVQWPPLDEGGRVTCGARLNRGSARTDATSAQ